MKHVFVFAFLVSLTTVTNGQLSLGIKGGMNSTTTELNDSEGAFYYGLYANERISKMSLQVELVKSNLLVINRFGTTVD